MKNSIKRAASIIALGAVAASVCSVNAFAAGNFSADNGFDAGTIANSPVKPVLTATQEVITLAEAKTTPTRNVSITISGAEEKYASTGIHIYYDKRLTIAENRFGGVEVAYGDALAYLDAKKVDPDPTAADYDMKGIFVCTAGDADKGLDGVAWTLSLTLPSDVAEGDVFPIDILYRSNETNEDLFVNKNKDSDGKLMQAYAFTRGIFCPENPTFAAPAADVAKCAALADLDKTHDGYIAIADGEKPTEPPTTPPTEPPTQAPTTEAPTEAPTTEAPTAAETTTAGTGATTTAAPKATTTAKATTTKPAATTAKKDDSPKTGVAGVGVAVAGLAAAIGTAFVLRKKED